MAEEGVAPAQIPTPAEFPLPTQMLEEIAKVIDLMNAQAINLATSLNLPMPPPLPTLPPMSPGLFIKQAERVSVYRFPYGGMPGKDLTRRYLTSYTGRRGEYAEIYAFCYGTDVDALVSIMPTNNQFLFEITRFTVARLNVYIDGVHKGGFPELSPEEASTPSTGYIAPIA